MKNLLLYSGSARRERFHISPPGEKSKIEHAEYVSAHLSDNMKYTDELFMLSKNNDIVTRKFSIEVQGEFTDAFLIFTDGLCDSSSVNDFILRPLMNTTQSMRETLFDVIEKSLLPQCQLSVTDKINDALHTVNIGNAVLFADTVSKAFMVDVKSWEHRSVANPENEAVIQGPHEGFNEVLRCNTALIRKTLNTPRLIMENIAVGKTSQTPGAIAYIRDVTNESLVDEVRRRISLIDAEYVLSALDVEQYIEEASFLSVPQMITTERPDRVCKALTEGRVAFIMNGSPHVLIMPATFFDLITSAEDEYLRYPYSLLIRVIRYLAVFLSLLFPAVFVSLLNFHEELLLTNILLTVSSSRVLVPFGAFSELILMEISFELIKEAGIRVPGPIGSTIGIVGGLIVGQAAVDAGLVSPIMIIIVAVTGIASFTLPSYSLSFAFRFSRFLYILGAGVMGLFGVAVVFFINTLMAIDTRSFGVPFMSPVSPVGKRGKLSMLFGAPIWKRGTKRESYLRPKDMYKKAYISRKWRG